MPNMTSDQQLLAETESVFRQFMYMPHEHAYTVATLWSVHTHLRLHDGSFAPQRTPRLYFGSKQAGCGKTMAMELVTLLSHNGEIHTVPTQFSIVSAINNNLGTVALDEIDLFFGARGTSKSDIRAILNSGYKAGANVTRQRNDEVEYLNVHGPIVTAGKNLNRMLTSDAMETMRTRSIIIPLERKPAGYDVERYRSGIHEPRIRTLSGRIKRWGRNNAPHVVAMDVEHVIPHGIDNRDEEIWTVLVQLAHYVGGVWPQRIDAAMRAMVLGQFADDEEAILSPADELLAWVRSVYREDEEFLRTTAMIQRLMSIPDDVWWRREWRNPRAASMGLATALGVFGVECVRERLDGEQVRGYRRCDVEAVGGAQDDADEPDETGLVDASSWEWSEIE